MSYLASVAKTEVLKRTSGFDTFSSFGVSVNSPLRSNLVALGKQYVDLVDSGKYQGSFTTQTGTTDVGNTTGDGYQLDDAYRVSIFSEKLGKRISAFLQNTTSMQVRSKWSEFIPISSSNMYSALNSITQLLGGSLVSKISSRRMWRGTDPISMDVKLRFEAVSDPIAEVICPCIMVLQLASPGGASFNKESILNSGELSEEGIKSFKKELTGAAASTIEAVIGQILLPPGPSPFWHKEDENGKVIFGDRITIKIGNFLSFNNVIISKADVALDSKIHRSGNPISATASITFETYEVLTKDDVNSAFRSGIMGGTDVDFTGGITGAISGVKGALKTAGSAVKSAASSVPGGFTSIGGNLAKKLVG